MTAANSGMTLNQTLHNVSHCEWTAFHAIYVFTKFDDNPLSLLLSSDTSTPGKEKRAALSGTNVSHVLHNASQ